MFYSHCYKDTSRGTTEEIHVNKTTIPNSHICDILKFTLNKTLAKRPPPIGYLELLTVLEDLNIPKSLRVNNDVTPKKSSQGNQRILNQCGTVTEKKSIKFTDGIRREVFLKENPRQKWENRL